MEYIKNIFMLLCLFSISCIGSQLPHDLQKPNPVTTTSAPLLAGDVVTYDGQFINIQQFANQNLVVMFAQFFCDVCKKEAADILASLKTNLAEPTNTKLMTIVISASQAKAAKWKVDQNVPWLVAAAPNNLLLKQYCPEGLTPCTVIHKPAQGIVFIKQGEVFPEEIMQYVGPWTFAQPIQENIKEKINVPKVHTGNPKLDAILNDPKNICTTH